MLASPKFMRDSTKVNPLSDILRPANAHPPAFTGGLTAGKPWSIRFPKPDKLKFFAILKEHCWLRMDDRSLLGSSEIGAIRENFSIR